MAFVWNTRTELCIQSCQEALHTYLSVHWHCSSFCIQSSSIPSNCSKIWAEFRYCLDIIYQMKRISVLLTLVINKKYTREFSSDKLNFYSWKM